jgi:CDP-diacylglycerol--serine O-phosphatidyltransferase
MNGDDIERELRSLGRERERRLLRFNRIPLRFLLPNMITLLALCSGVTAIRLGLEGRMQLAVGAIILATVLDAIDGRLARVLKGQSRFGAELDSLADFVNFGVAPAVLMYIWSLHALRNLGWIAALALAICCALRLARFNVALDDPNKPPWAVYFFTGVPAPAGAALAIAPMYLGFLGFIPDGQAAAPYILPYVVAVAVAMVSKLPTYSGKGLGGRISRDMVLPILAGFVATIVLLIAFTWEMLTLLALLYIGLLPFGVRSYLRYRAADAKAAREVATPEGQG